MQLILVQILNEKIKILIALSFEKTYFYQSNMHRKKYHHFYPKQRHPKRSHRVTLMKN